MLTEREIPQFLQNVLRLMKKTLNATAKEQEKSCKELISMLKSASVDSFNSNHDLQEKINKCDENIQNLMENLSCGSEEMAELMLQLSFGRFHFIKTFCTKEKKSLYLFKLTNISMVLKTAILKQGNQGIRNNFKHYYPILDDVLMEMYELDEVDSETKSKQVAWFLSHFNLCCTEIKDHGKSIDLHKKAIAIMEFAWGKKASNCKIFGHCLSNIARVFEQTEDYEEAKSFYEAALDAYNKAADLDIEKKKKDFQNFSLHRKSFSKVEKKQKVVLIK